MPRSRSDSKSKSGRSKCCYRTESVQLIKKCYIFAIFFWVFLILVLRIFPSCSALEFLVLLIPVAVFLISYNAAPFITEDVENFMTSGLLAFGLFVVIPILTAIHERIPENTEFLKLGMVALVFGLLSLIDIWVPSCHISVVKHIKSILRTYAIVLIIYILFHFFITLRGGCYA